jgi:hypothetical protein
MLAFDGAKTVLEENWPNISFAASEKPGDTGIYRRVGGFGMDFDNELGVLIEKAHRARLRKLQSRVGSPVGRRFGPMRGKARTTARFFKPLPEVELRAREGRPHSRPS